MPYFNPVWLMHINTAMHRRVLRIALPMVAAAISAPLPGIVDTALLGHLEDVRYLSAVAAGTTALGLLIWTFSFLRMGTTSVTAQALGAQDDPRNRLVLAQSLVLATAIGLLLVVLQTPALTLILAAIAPPPESAALALSYCSIRILGAPATLGTFCLIGWLIGNQKARLTLALMLVTNATNIVLDLIFILGLDLHSDGAAWASLIAEYLGFALGLWLAFGLQARLAGSLQPTQLRQLHRYRSLFTVNGHLLIRTACLVFAFAFFTANGARQGAEVLAANAILMELFFLLAFALDGFAHAAEALTGHAVGARDSDTFYAVCRTTCLWGVAIAGAVTALYLIFSAPIIGLFTDIPEVATTAAQFFPWLATIPLVAVGGFMFDGIFLGAGRTRPMLYIMLVAVLLVFIPVWYATRTLGNHGLWLAFVIFMASRTLMMGAAFAWITRRGWTRDSAEV